MAESGFASREGSAGRWPRLSASTSTRPELFFSALQMSEGPPSPASSIPFEDRDRRHSHGSLFLHPPAWMHSEESDKKEHEESTMPDFIPSFREALQIVSKAHEKELRLRGSMRQAPAVPECHEVNIPELAPAPAAAPPAAEPPVAAPPVPAPPALPLPLRVVSTKSVHSEMPHIFLPPRGTQETQVVDQASEPEGGELEESEEPSPLPDFKAASPTSLESGSAGKSSDTINASAASELMTAVATQARQRKSKSKDRLYEQVRTEVATHGSPQVCLAERFTRNLPGLKFDEPITQLLINRAWPGWIQREQSTDERLKSRLTRFVESNLFHTFCAMIILMNATVIALETDWSAKHMSDHEDTTPATYGLFNLTFTLCFIVELVLRFLASEHFYTFFTGKDWSWNIFDTGVVLIDALETVFAAFTMEELPSMEVMRILRVLRIARTIRLIRLIRAFRELRMMIMSILRSGIFLIWSMVMLGIIIYTFAIYFVQWVTLHRKLHGGTGQMNEMFGSLNDCAYYLFLSMSGGISWYEVENPLYQVHWTNRIMMCFFIFFTVFSWLNIITGIFVDTAVNSAQRDRDEVIQEEMNQKRSTVRELYELFQEADCDGDGYLSCEEFEHITAKKEIQAVLASLGMEVGEARGLFALLDQDDSKLLSAEEFIVGCMRVSGGARSVDLMALMYENKKMIQVWKLFMEHVDEYFVHHSTSQARLEGLTNQVLSLVKLMNRPPQAQRLPL